MREIMVNQNKYWKAKFEKYYKKFAKLENLYEGYLASLQNV